MELDPGDRKVQLWHFGPGNTPGDTIVYVAEAKVAWTGNFLSNELIGNTMLLEGGPRDYLDTLARCKNPLGLNTAAIEAIKLDQRFLVSRFSPASRVNWLIKNFHRLNVVDLSGVGQGTRSL